MTVEKKEEKISKATIARMPLYLHFLQEENTKGILKFYIKTAAY